jgi:putative transposase
MRSDWDISIRRACRVFLVDASTYHHRPRRPRQAALEQRIRELCQTRVRYGYRRAYACCGARGAATARTRRGASIAS